MLETIFREGPITRPEIATATSLSKPTVSAAVSAGSSRPVSSAPPARAPGQRGRKPVAYVVVQARRLRRRRRHRRHQRPRRRRRPVRRADLRSASSPTTKDGSRAVGVQILEMVSEVIDQAGASHGRPLALGISSPGVVDRSERPRHVARLQRGARGRLRPARGDPRAASTCPCSSRTTSTSRRSARSGSAWRAASRRMVFIGDRRRHRDGHRSSTTSSSGARTAPPARSATCRSSAIPSTRATGCTAGSRTRSAPPGSSPRSRAPRRGDSDGELSSAHEVFELAGTGDAIARAVVEHVASRLGTAIATVCAILDPELVVLGGGIGASPLLLRPVRGAAAALVPITARIETSLLGERAALQGAIAVALQAARGAAAHPRAARSDARKNVVSMRSAATLSSRWPRSRSSRSASATATARVAVRDLDLEIADGEFMVLVGPSGCGKTTLLRMIAGLEDDHRRRDPRSASDVVNDLTPRERDIAMVFQNYALYPHMTVAENMGFALSCARRAEPRRSDARCSEAAELLGIDRAARAQAARTCPAASASASRWAARSCATRRRSSWTSRCPTSTPSCAIQMRAEIAAHPAQRCGPRPSTSPTTRPRR